MTPIPQELASEAAAAVTGLDGDSLVISGMSGTYANCLHVEDFSRILYNKENPISAPTRWTTEHPEVPDYYGTCPEMEKFDAQYFKVNNQLANSMDPMSRKLKEHVNRAIYDAGLSIDSLNGRNIGVYIGASLAETIQALYYYDYDLSASTLPGCSKAMFANRISYWLNIRGPSMQVDDACASSIAALEEACRAIKRGDCEAAIVGASSVWIHPQTQIHLGRLIPLCKDGKTKAYDENADGSIKADAVCVFFLQKAKDAVRIYAEVIHAKNEFDMNSSGIYRNSESLSNFLNEFYKEVDVNPKEIDYVEGFGCGIPQVDKAELEAIDEVFCKDRKDALLVGSVTSNFGYTEACTGFCGITKVLLGYKTGLLAGNLHCSQPRQDVAGLREGRIQIVNEHVPFSGKYAAVSAMSIMGINSHVLLRGYYKPRQIIPKAVLPRLIPLSGRQEEAVQNLIDYFSKRPIDPEEVALLHNIHQGKNTGHLGRGYAILDTDEKGGETVCLASSVDHFDDMKRPLWFVYSGMGSQWVGMGKQLMRIPTFAAAIERCDKVLKPRGLDIVNIICSPDKTMFDNILHSFVGIAAVQIGLTDVLRQVGIVPDKIIGHSVGELGCGYADGCLTAEEMVLAAFSRGTVSLQTKLINGSMAAVGIGYQQAVKLCPPEIDVACHNGPESCTISGPAEPMKAFVEKLTGMGIFAKEVPCSNIAYHSRYIADAGPKLLEYLTEAIKNPKRRTERWVSTSVPQDRWEEEQAQYCSAWYHTNNLLSPVLFEETSRLIPENAVVVEVAPHGLLQAILKRSLPSDCRHVPVTKRGHPDNTLFFLQAIGKLFMHGYQPTVKNLYPEVQFPVSTETPGLSHLPEWNKTDEWPLALYRKLTKEKTTIYNSHISIHDEENKYLTGNVIAGKNVYPLAAILSCVWDTFAMLSNTARGELSVQFSEVNLYSQPALFDLRPLHLSVTIQRGTGEFEVVTPISKVATGIISQYLETLPKYEATTDDNTTLDGTDIYKLFQERDYSYSGEFRSIHKSNYSFTAAELLWKDNWVSFIDGVLQLNAVRRDHDAVSQPSRIHSLILDVKAHEEYKKTLDGTTLIPAVVSLVYDYTRCGGVLMEKVQFADLPPLNGDLPVLQAVPENKSNMTNLYTAIKNVSLQMERIGDLKSLKWVGTDSDVSKASSDDLVTVQYAGISVYDVNVATGVYSRKRGYQNRNVYGMEYSGTTDTGKRVMGLVRGGAASKRVTAVPGLTWPVPEPWTLEDAATVPLAYAQAFYCLGIKTQLLPGMKVLVHGGSGALGQAVIHIALANQCTVFTTVADEHKKEFLLQLFPQLTEDVIGCSRDTSFADMVLDATDGEGCDIAITCAAGKLKNMTLKCVAYCGITFDLTQAHLEEPFTYGMSFMTKQRSYVQVNFFSIFEKADYAKALQSMVSEGIARGYVKPLSRVTFPAQESTRAFRLLAASRHRGRVLLRLPRDVTPAHTRFTCSPDKTQLVVCREDSLSYQFVNRLIKCGARKILLHHTTPTPLVQHKIASWKDSGIDISTSTIPLSNPGHAEKLLAGRDVEGIYVICPGNAQERMMVSSLDAVSRTQVCPGLKYFAFICTEGPMDHTLCHSRRELNHPTTMLSLDKILKTSSVVSKSTIMDAIESALSSSQKMLYVDIQKSPKPSLLQEIAEKADFRLPVHVQDDTTLQQLGLDTRYVSAVCVMLRSLYGISLPEDRIPYLTVKTLREHEASLSEPKFLESPGLPALVGHVAAAEDLAFTTLVALPTRIKSPTVYDLEIDQERRNLWIVPGVEGQYERFKNLCLRLQLPAVVLQPPYGPKVESYHDVAQRYIKELELKSNMNNYNDFYLLGYETGVLTAFEMAAILEKQGKKGTVFCLGGSPDEILQYVKKNLNNLNEDQLQTALIQHMVSLMADGPVQNVDSLIQKGSSTLQDKLYDSMRILMQNVPRTTLYATGVIQGAYARIQQALQHKIQVPTLKSRVVLLRTTSTSDMSTTSLSEEVVSYDIDAPLMYATAHPVTAAIINSNLSEEVKEEFKKQNLCETHAPACGFVYVQG
ncbi:hypothetical protein O0L34_g4119 [Tuta absoluta]|nr:hypothetical protein O0L34_g4119 [Tuta absoluta]